MMVQPAFSAVLYVDAAHTTGTQNGQSWATAYAKLEDAIFTSQSGDEIWVAKGTYQRDNHSGFPYVYSMKNGVKIYGGFLTGATLLSERNWKNNPTILKAFESNSIFQNTDVNSSAVLDGFIIRDATSTAMINTRSSPTLNNIDFIDNTESRSNAYGGALRNMSNSNPILTNVRFIGNKVTRGNWVFGGAIYNQSDCTIKLNNVVFLMNKAEAQVANDWAVGGAIYNLGSLILNNVVFDKNECTGVANTMGGAIASSGGNIKMNNTIFTGNSAYSGSMIYGDNANYEIIHTTGYKNVYTPSSWYSGFALAGNSVVKIANSIFMANSAWSTATTITVAIENSFFDVDYPSGSANINAVNLPFTNANNPIGDDGNWFTADDGLQISLDAKVTPVDKGRAISAPNYSTDLIDIAGKDILGLTRPQGFANDLGAYEAAIEQKVFYVDSANVSGVYDGLSWATAFNKLEDGLSQAALSTGSNVWVAKGTYSPPANQSFKMGRTTQVYGGFSNNSTDFSQRDWKANPTILKGSGAGVFDNDYLNDAGNVTGWAILEGFTITGGNNTKGGAGMYNKYASPDLKNIIFVDNQTTGSGGAFYSEGSSSILTDVTFKNNIAGADGGAIYVTQIGNKLTYTSLVFINNRANNGGAIANLGNNANLDIVNTVFENNYASLGGAVYNTSVWSINFTNTIFAGNTAGSTATVHNAGSGKSVYLNVSFSKNTATNNITLSTGQAISLITNSVFWGNSTGFTNASFYSCYGQTGGISSPFANADIPAGPDGIWKTKDDGIQLKYEAGTINKGNALTDGNTNLSSSMINAAKKDVLGTNRGAAATYDLGAYEYVLPNFTRFYVDASNSATLKNGGSWASAYSTLQQVFADANLEAGDSIWVAKGTYMPATGQSFIMKEGVKVFGGFSNNATDQSERDFKANETVLQGNGGRVITNQFTAANPMTANSILDGFTISNGNQIFGGGIYNSYASPILRNLIIKNNTADYGAGIYLAYSNSLIENVWIDQNTAEYSGGGMGVEYGSEPIIRNAIISNNINNFGTGGGIDFYEGSGTLINVVLNGNEAMDGGGINSFLEHTPVKLTNVVFYKNKATNNGAGFHGISSSAKFTNVTFAGNMASGSGGGFYQDADNTNKAKIVNSIFWGNTDAGGASDLVGDNAFQIDSSFTQNDHSLNSTGNILGTSSPFLDIANALGGDGIWFTADDGLQPVKTSPVINAGSNIAASGIALDITGRSRIFNTSIDMGAYEAYPASDANLSALVISAGTLDPAFNAAITDYEVEVSYATENIIVTATYGDAVAKAVINNENAVVLTSGTASVPLALPVGFSTIEIIVKAADSLTVKTYTINVLRAKGDQQINPVATITKAFGDADFEPGATATSNLVVNYSSSDVTIAQPYQDTEDNNKWKIKILKPGAVNITASQPGDLTYKPAEDVVFSIVVSKGNATITLSNLSATYDGTAKAVIASTAPVGLNGITITYDGSSTAPTAAGTYVVVAKLTNDSYSASDVTGNLVISKGNQIISFPAFANRNTSSADFEPGATIDTGLPLTYSSSNTSVAVVYQDALDGNKWKIRVIGEGLTNITAQQGGSANYEAASVIRTLVIEPVTLPVSLTTYFVKKDGNRVQLTWNTSSEKDNDYFEIQRSFDGVNYQRLTTVNASENSTFNNSYMIYDYNPANGDNYYRLIQYDIDGKHQVLGNRVVNFSIDPLVGVQVYPNPAVEEVNLSFTGFINKDARVVITDMSGKITHKETISVLEGNAVYRLALASKLTSGQYIINVNGIGLKAILKLVVLD